MQLWGKMDMLHRGQHLLDMLKVAPPSLPGLCVAGGGKEGRTKQRQQQRQLLC